MSTGQRKIIFLGTPEFSVFFLRALVEANLKPTLVITSTDQPVGRRQEMQSPPVRMAARQHGIPVVQVATPKELEEALRTHQPDVCVLVAFGMIVSTAALTIPPHGIVNVHPSLLPKYRGPSPVQAAILNGDEFTGVTLMQLDERIDHGPLLAQKQLPILPTDTNVTLHDRLAMLGSDLLVATLPQYLDGKITPRPQEEAAATHTKIIKREDGLIDWQQSAEAIERRFRAFQPWPGVYTLWQGKRLKLSQISVAKGNTEATLEPGTKTADKNEFIVACGQGAVVIHRLQLEGKKEISAADFLRGFRGDAAVRFS